MVRRGSADDDGPSPTSTAGRGTNTFDVIIVGAGPSSIGLLHGLLRHSSSSSSESDNFRIAVVERGSGPPHHRTTANVRDWFTAAHGRNGDAAVLRTTSPQRGLNGRVLEAPAGSGLGGGTNVNACLCSEPDFDHDFEDWPGRWRGGGLLRDAVEELERVMEANGGLHEWTTCDNYHRACGGGRQQGGSTEKISIRKEGLKMEYVPSFLLASNPKLERVNYYDSILYPLLKSRPDLNSRVTFFTGTSVRRILFRGNVAVGVECKRQEAGSGNNGCPFTLRASREVILCAGAFVSPALLMVSGIGDEATLRKIGVSPVVAHLPAVGQNLRDHTILPRAYVTPPQFGRRTSANCVQAHYMVTIPKKGKGGDEMGAQGKRDDSAVPAEGSANDDRGNASNRECYRVQMSLTDGAVSTVVLPYFLASPLRRGFESSPSDDGSSLSAVMLARAFWCLFAVVRLALRFLLAFTPIRLLIVHCTATINVCMLNPRSTGAVTVRPKDRLGGGDRRRGGRGNGKCEGEGGGVASLDGVELRIDPGYLTDVDDRAALVAAWRSSDDVARRHFGSCVEVLPGPLGSFIMMLTARGEGPAAPEGIEGWLVSYASNFLLPYYHWCGTCAMGGDRGGGGEGTPSKGDDRDEDGLGGWRRPYVVGNDMRVLGVRNLRVCDASVFPDCVSAPTALTCAGLGYAISKTVAMDIIGAGRE